MTTPYKLIGMTENDFLNYFNDNPVGDKVYAADAETLEEAIKLVGFPNLDFYASISSQLSVDDKTICLVSNLTSEDMDKKVSNKLSSLEDVTKSALESLLTTVEENGGNDEVNFVVKLLTAFPIPDDFEQTLLSGETVCGGACGTETQTKTSENKGTDSNELFEKGLGEIQDALSKLSELEESNDRIHKSLVLVLDETKSVRSIADKLHQQINQTLPIESSYTAEEMDAYINKVMSALDDDDKIFDFCSTLLNRMLVMDAPQKIHTLDTMAQLICEVTGVIMDNGDE